MLIFFSVHKKMSSNDDNKTNNQDIPGSSRPRTESECSIGEDGTNAKR